MNNLFIYLFGTVAVLGGLLTILQRHPIASAMSLILSFFAVASLYVLVEAHFLWVIQVLVYIGAIMVLIVYTILLMDLRSEDLRGSLHGVQVLGLILGVGWLTLLLQGLKEREIPPEASLLPPGFGTLAHFGKELFTTYFYPFELVGIFLLAIIVGAYTLARKPKE
jgi:NADH-quinone oxidoreductase subunit J